MAVLRLHHLHQFPLVVPPFQKVAVGDLLRGQNGTFEVQVRYHHGVLRTVVLGLGMINQAFVLEISVESR